MRVGIDMGGMSIKIGLVSDENVIKDRIVIPTRLDIPASDLIDEMIVAVEELLKRNGIETSDIRGIGIGSPGTVDDKTGTILYSNNFFWENVAIVPQMKKRFPVEICLGNDADVAALGEVCAGAAKGSKSAILITLGTGVGGGVIINQHIFHGPLNGGMELGHMVIKADGEPCTCGRKGCFEAYGSATALLRIARKHASENETSLMNQMCDGNLENMNGIIPFEAAKMGDEAALLTIEEYENNLAEGIANIINIFRPEIIILGGGVAAQKDNLTRPLSEKVQPLCFGGVNGQVSSIVTSKLGNDAGMIGAACMIQ